MSAVSLVILTHRQASISPSSSWAMFNLDSFDILIDENLQQCQLVS
jgi:hypothetical protein